MELRTGAVQLPLTGWYGNDLDRRVKCLTLLSPPRLINLAERSFPDLLDDLPFRPHGNRKLLLHSVSPLSPGICCPQLISAFQYLLVFRVLIISRHPSSVCIFRFSSRFFHTILRNFSQKDPRISDPGASN